MRKGMRACRCCRWWGGRSLFFNAMRENKEFIINCCLFWTILFSVSYITDSDNDFFLLLLVVPISIISWLILSGVAVYRFLVRSYLPWETRLIPLYFSVAPVIALFMIGAVTSAIREDSTWLVITNADFRGSNNFRFMKDGEYSSWRDSPLGRSAEESGRY